MVTEIVKKASRLRRACSFVVSMALVFVGSAVSSWFQQGSSDSSLVTYDDDKDYSFIPKAHADVASEWWGGDDDGGCP